MGPAQAIRREDALRAGSPPPPPMNMDILPRQSPLSRGFAQVSAAAQRAVEAMPVRVKAELAKA